MIKALSVLILLAGAVGCSESKHWKPSELSLVVSNSFDYGYKLELRNGDLYYYAVLPNPKGWDAAQPVKITPTEDQWKDLRRSLDRCSAWRWKKDYNVLMMDGWAWKLDLQYSDRRLESEGANNGPRSLDDVLSAFERLTGGKAFHIDRG